MQEGNQAGRRLVAGRYAVLSELGRGGIGVVWRAQDQVIGRQVALKELRIPPGLGQQERDTFLQRALREARTAGALNDPAIVTVYDVVPEGGAMYIVMELIEASTLADLVAGGPLPEPRATDLGRQMLSALETAHAAGIVHRDIKPSNIMVLPGDRVKLTDFGIAQAMDDPSLTATGGIMGSPGYMAPELFHGDPPSPATDLWSLGATLYHVVEGRAPFQRDSTAATMHAIMYDDPRLHRCTGPLAGIIMGLLVHAPEQRLTAPQVRARLSAASTRAVPADAERTDVLPMITDDAERTALVDRERTTAVTRRPRSTRPWGGDNEANEFTEVVPTASAVDPAASDAWGSEPRKPRRRALLIGAAVVVVLALVGVAFALTRPAPNAVASPPPSRGSATSTPSSTTAPTSAPPTSTSAATNTTTAPPATTTHTQASTRAAGGGNSLGGGAPPPPPPPPASPTLTYVQINRYNNSVNEYHITLTTKQTVPANYTKEGPVGDLLTTAGEAPNTMPFYLCQVTGGQPFYFSSTSTTCEGWKVVTLEGYIYGVAPSGATSAALYRCTANSTYHSKYDSLDPNCEGNGTADGRLGYVV
ncbi:MAG TPA: serine/threonine-protein kinase [Pseudonocardiaceae bacterium]